ncbi:MAG: ComF family protein [Pseudomonadota bacterium]
MRLQIALRTIYPPECLACGALVDQEFALCPSCWSETPFILGAACDLCGAALPGQADASDDLICDECRRVERPWKHGRAVWEYRGLARQMVLGLKHGDRADIARAAGPWLARAAGDLIKPDTALVPVPLHPFRLWRRRYNQSALLVQALARSSGAVPMVDGLIRTRSTPSLDGKSGDERFALMDGAIAPNPKRRAEFADRTILLVDDVMTSGATLAAATAAALGAGARHVCVIVLARVAKDA